MWFVLHCSLLSLLHLLPYWQSWEWKEFNSNLATAIRTVVVVLLAWFIVFITGSRMESARSVQKAGSFLFFLAALRGFPGSAITGAAAGRSIQSCSS